VILTNEPCKKTKLPSIAWQLIFFLEDKNSNYTIVLNNDVIQTTPKNPLEFRDWPITRLRAKICNKTFNEITHNI
jgi:hypothetical protein